MARPRSSVRRPIPRPHVVPTQPVPRYPSAEEQIRAARARLHDLVGDDGTDDADERLEAARAAARRRVAAAKPKTPTEQILANQKEILRRLSAIESSVARYGQRLQHFFGGDDDEPHEEPPPPSNPDKTPVDPPAPPPETDPASAPTQPLDPPLADPPQPDLPAPEEPAPDSEDPTPDAG